MITHDIKSYRKDYYRKHRDYLLEYSKWYYSFNKYKNGMCELSEVRNKPKKMFNRKNRKKKENEFAVFQGPIILTFD